MFSSSLDAFFFSSSSSLFDCKWEEQVGNVHLEMETYNVNKPSEFGTELNDLASRKQYLALYAWENISYRINNI